MLWTLLVAAPVAQAAWFDTNWKYRVAINVPAAASVNSTIKLDADFAALLTALGASGSFDANSPRIVRPNDALATTQEFTDSIYAGTTDAVGNSRGELRFILQDAGPATYYLYFDVTASSLKAANPQPPINGNFERAAAGTQSPAGWTATRGNNNVDIQVRPSENPSVTTDFGTPATTVTDGTPVSGAFSYLMGARTNNVGTVSPSATLSRSIAVPATNTGNLVVRYRPEGWDSCDNGATQYDCLRIRLVGSTTTEIVGPTAGNYYTFPFSPNKRAAQFTNTQPGYGRYNFWDIDGGGNHDAGGMTIAAGSQPWFTRTFSLAGFAGQTVTLEFVTSHVTQYKTWFHVDDVEWSVVAATLGTPEVQSALPGGFNAYETTTAAGAVTGVIKTKIAGSAFNLDVVALNMAKTAIEPAFVGSVKVELLDASNNSAALDANGCRASWNVIQTVTTSLAFATADRGRKSQSFLESNAWRNVRVRISYPATGAATAVGCSTDAFAIRPAAFGAPLATDADWQSAGLTRSLGNGNATGGAAHKAGRPFTLRSSALNGVGAVTTNYTGTPIAFVSACGASGCGAVLGTLTMTSAAVAGSVTDAAATYSEAGAFNLQLLDDSFASIDAGDSSVAERRFASATVLVGRFVPDRFELTPAVAPIFRTFNDAACATRSFTYIGQRFGFVTLPRASVSARNAAGAITASYRAALWKLTSAAVTQTYAPLAPASPGLDLGGIGVPSLASNEDGSGSYTANAADTLYFVRSLTTPQNEFDASITLSVSVADATEAAVAGNGSITASAPLVFNGGGSGIAFDAGNRFRYGRLVLGNAYGSDLLDLAIPMETQYWNGFGFVTNGADHCTTIAAPGIRLAAYAPAGFSGNVGVAHVSLGGRFSGGSANLKLLKPAPPAQGSLTLCVDLDSGAAGDTACQATAPQGLTFLQGRWSGSNYDKDPSARASFGRYKGSGRLIYQRENY